MSLPLPGARRALALLALVVVAATTVLLALGASSQAASTQTITVGVPRNFGYLSTLWARNVQPKGIKVEYKYFPVFTDMLTALNSGQIDLTEVGDVGALQSFVNTNGKVKIVAVTQPNDLNGGLIVPKNSTVKTFADLKGKRVVFLKSTNTYPGFLHLLKRYKLKESDFTISEISGPAANAAFTSGQIPGYFTIDPNLADIGQHTGARKILTYRDMGVANIYPYVATSDAIKSKPKAIAAVVKALSDNFEWIKKNPAKQAQLVAPKLGFTEAAIKVTNRRGAQGLQMIDKAWLKKEQKVIDEYAQTKIIAKPVKASDVFLSTFNSSITPAPAAKAKKKK